MKWMIKLTFMLGVINSVPVMLGWKVGRLLVEISI